MKIEVKQTNLTKSKINQMDYVGVSIRPDAEILGWVNMGKYKFVIIKVGEAYYRADFIISVDKKNKGIQSVNLDGTYNYIYRMEISMRTKNHGTYTLSTDENDDKNIEKYDNAVSFKRRTEIAGQIYY